MKDYSYDKRKYILAGIVILVLVTYILQIYNLQINNSDYKTKADSNAFYKKTLYPARGLMYDRNGKLVVYNQPSYDITFVPREIKGLDTLEFCKALDITVDEFNARKADGTMAGHVGFAESVGMICEGLGWKLDKFEQDMEPIVTDVDRKSPYGFAPAGHVAGVAMKGWGYVDGEMKIEMDHPQQIEPEQVGVHTGDYVFIKGTPDVNMSNTPEIEGGIGTMAMILNSIPHVINARPGLKTMIDIPVVRAIMGDMRDMIEPECKIVK